MMERGQNACVGFLLTLYGTYIECIGYIQYSRCTVIYRLYQDIKYEIKTSSVKNVPTSAYLLGLLAMIKCSICSYQCDN